MTAAKGYVLALKKKLCRSDLGADQNSFRLTSSECLKCETVSTHDQREAKRSVWIRYCNVVARKLPQLGLPWSNQLGNNALNFDPVDQILFRLKYTEVTYCTRVINLIDKNL